jgi:hypothetical protein
MRLAFSSNPSGRWRLPMAMPAISHPSGRDKVNVTSIWIGRLRGWLDCGSGLTPLSSSSAAVLLRARRVLMRRPWTVRFGRPARS